MRNMEELLEYGLPQLGELARPADLSSRVVQEARGIRRRRALARGAVFLPPSPSRYLRPPPSWTYPVRTAGPTFHATLVHDPCLDLFDLSYPPR